MFIGTKIKEFREFKKRSLTELSKQSGVQLATLSRIENLKMTGTVESHMHIARALGVDITELYKEVIKEETKTEIQTPKSLHDTFSHSDQAYFEILTGNVLSKKMMPILLKIEPRGKTNIEQNKSGSEKFVFVLDGEIEVTVGSKTYPLLKNSTLYFEAAQEHFFANKGKNPAKVICIVTPVEL